MQETIAVARVRDGRVENIEVATAEWIAGEEGRDGFTFVPYSDSECVNIGMRWSPTDGFYEEEEPLPPS